MTFPCPSCRQPVTLPADWHAPGYTCPHCHQPAQLPRLAPVHEFRERGTFAAAFGDTLGHLTATAVYVLVVVTGLVGLLVVGVVLTR